jgi:hypothetical protein
MNQARKAHCEARNGSRSAGPKIVIKITRATHISTTADLLLSQHPCTSKIRTWIGMPNMIE